MNETLLNEILEYSKAIFKELHMHPEIGFELDNTVKLVSNELTKMGIQPTLKYGKGSVVADIGQGEKLIALRADMDALPVNEKTDLPYASKIPGAMHACGHDSHTAILLGVAKYLKMHESELTKRVRLVFQPSEECAISGAKMMVDNGVMDGVDHIICTHCENDMDVGNIGVCYGDYMAACIPWNVRFSGRTAHAALSHLGIDAVAMGADAYFELKNMIKSEAEDLPYIWNVGRFSGGEVHNVVPDNCEMDISFRWYDIDFANRVEVKAKEICKNIAKKYGGSVEIDWHISTLPVYNDESITKDFEDKAKAAGISVIPMPKRMSSEDFAWYLEKAPGMIFRYGTRNEEKGCTALAHRNDFKIDPIGMKYAIWAFVSYITK